MIQHTLYGSPLSLFTGKARSYLIKAGISYRETLPNSAHFKNEVLPKMGGRQSIPVIETSEGVVIRDGAAIIDYFEAKSGHFFSPSTPKQRILALLLDVIGCEGLLRPAMHYRWNFPKQNLAFIQFHFETFVPKGLDKKETATKRMDQMRGAGRAFGVTPESHELIESQYTRLVVKLDEHFVEQPYLFGGRPSIGDFGMIAPLYGHLGRDPAPLSLMQSKAIRLCRWVERMNRAEPDVGEFENQSEEFLPNDEVPQSLIEVLKHMALDFVPETKAACLFINQWLSDNQSQKPGAVAERGVGTTEFETEGLKIAALAQPYRFYLLARMQSEYDALGGTEKSDVDALLLACGMKDVLDCRLSRDVGRHDNREVWL
ncbi:MAG: glutathione S-transferase [Pseudohongiellaceae bacterium]|jgi:glutathione S-transferase